METAFQPRLGLERHLPAADVAKTFWSESVRESVPMKQGVWLGQFSGMQR